MKKGKLYLIPTTLGENSLKTIPQYVIDILHQLKFFIAERAKTARHYIKETQPIIPFSEMTFYELNKRTEKTEWQTFLKEIDNGNNIGLLSEAGCPGVADPGAVIVELAHQKGVEVVPLVGPSSILLALMGSGLNGQNFSFQGYLSPKKDILAKELKRHESLAQKLKQTQIFIETPYRNNAFIEIALKNLSNQTYFCIAADLTLEEEFIKTLRVEQWRKEKLPELHKRPCIFLIGV